MFVWYCNMDTSLYNKLIIFLFDFELALQDFSCGCVCIQYDFTAFHHLPNLWNPVRRCVILLQSAWAKRIQESIGIQNKNHRNAGIPRNHRDPRIGFQAILRPFQIFLGSHWHQALSGLFSLNNVHVKGSFISLLSNRWVRWLAQNR